MATSLTFYKKYKYEAIAVVSGASVMIIELAGARIIAPEFGASIYIWTSVIGVILGALSFGYWYGGRLADKSASNSGLALILFMAALVWLLSVWLKDGILSLASDSPGGLRAQAFIASFMLFAPVSFFLGTVSPYLVKLKLVDMKTAGRNVGGLYAAGTAGSIIGTFLAGYFLLPLLSVRVVAAVMVIVLLAVSFMADYKSLLIQRLALVVLSSLFLFTVLFNKDKDVVYEGDGLYSHYKVVDGSFKGQPARFLITDKLSAQSGIYLNNLSEPLFGYIARMVEIMEQSQPKSALLIGGGSYTLPTLMADRLPSTEVDIVEIDPKLDSIASEFFKFQPREQVRIYHEDGRTFINQTDKRYDMIAIDAFLTLSPPFQLTTAEAINGIKKRLTSDGILAVNIISAPSGPKSKFLASEYATYKKIFSDVLVLKVDPEISDDQIQNLVLIAGSNRAALEPALSNVGGKLITVNTDEALVLTDDYAPVEAMTSLTSN